MTEVIKKYTDVLTEHYRRIWRKQPTSRTWSRGPAHDLPEGFCILEFQPRLGRQMWTYATCGMSEPTDENPLELHLFSPVQADAHVELLTAIAHYHRTGSSLGLGHTVNFGRPWLPGSHCSFGLVSLPYLDGPALEVLSHPNIEREVRCLWLIPITSAEVHFKKKHGIEALEALFEAANINYVDPLRPSLVPI